jgi:hypothetical protein
MSKKLEVGDEVVCVQWNHWDEHDNYYLENIISVTNTRAKTSGGTTLLREPNKHNKYEVYGKMIKRGYWILSDKETKQKILEIKAECDHESKINNWFRYFNPDFATKESLYKQFNQ